MNGLSPRTYLCRILKTLISTKRINYTAGPTRTAKCLNLKRLTKASKMDAGYLRSVQWWMAFWWLKPKVLIKKMQARLPRKSLLKNYIYHEVWNNWKWKLGHCACKNLNRQ